MDKCRQSRDWSEQAQCNLRRAICARCWRRRNIPDREVLNLKRASHMFQPIADIDLLQNLSRAVPSPTRFLSLKIFDLIIIIAFIYVWAVAL